MAEYTTTFPTDENPISESGTWDPARGEFQNFESTGGNAIPVTGGGAEEMAAYAGTPTFGDDQFSEVENGSNPTASGVAPLTRIEDSAEPFHYALYDEGNSVLNFYLYNGTTQQFFQLGSTITYSLGIGELLRLESVDDTHEGFVDGESQGTRTDSSLTGGQPGFAAYGSTSQEIASVTVGDVGAYDPVTLLAAGEMMLIGSGGMIGKQIV